jgi:PiT family inorganic phosphate transporter
MEVIIIVVIMVLIFDFINGFHDCANSIATVVSTRVLSPATAVAWAAFFNFIAFAIFKEHKVAEKMMKTILDPSISNIVVISGGLVGAIFWNLLTWFWGIPSSSSHALIGGFLGAKVVKLGFGHLIPLLIEIKLILFFIVLAPLIGILFSYTISIIVINISKNFSYSRVDNYFRKLQLVSSALFSIGHGGNDAQKSMGIIWGILIVSGYSTHDQGIPNWVVISCYMALGLGTLFGGWRIVKTMGQKIAKLKPFEGFCAETGGAATLALTAVTGIPASTTHTITGCIMGTGMTKRLSAVRWGVAGNILIAWILTIPASATVGGLTYYILSLFSGQ